MYRASIAIVDASRARLFTYERSSDAEGLHENLIEQRDLVNPARRMRPSDLFAENSRGDDHRDAHIDKLDEEFSHLIIDQLRDLMRGGTDRLIMCASPKMLGELRAARRDLDLANIEVDEVARDLVKLTPSQLREHLTSYGVLPSPPPRLS